MFVLYELLIVENMLNYLRKLGLLKSDPKKQAIVNLLRENDHCSYGEILKSLSLSPSKGSKIITELKEEGIISNKIMPPFFKLAGS